MQTQPPSCHGHDGYLQTGPSSPARTSPECPLPRGARLTDREASPHLQGLQVTSPGLAGVCCWGSGWEWVDFCGSGSESWQWALPDASLPGCSGAWKAESGRGSCGCWWPPAEGLGLCDALGICSRALSQGAGVNDAKPCAFRGKPFGHMVVGIWKCQCLPIQAFPVPKGIQKLTLF